ncbi:MAG: tetratricopeptide repeat protein [Alphaproteobacteria bacterium]|nr:tetratricopeptide repeat protein [Alphaproteobacteria bacterium]
MRKIEKLFIGISLFAVIAVTGTAIWHHIGERNSAGEQYHFPASKYGNFLAAQHAIYINDFDSAANFSYALTETEYPIVQNTKYISEFLSGYMPQNAKLLKSEKSMPARLIYDAYLVQQGEWKELHNRHKNDESALAAPLRIWSAIKNDYRTKTFNFIDKLPTNESWKSFICGQIYAELGDQDKAAEYFEKVSPDFMNINDYLYIMSFYTHHDMADKADALRAEFTTRPGGLFMSDYDNIPDWSMYSGYENQLGFSLVQNVSHTQIMMYSDLAILLLRFAEITAPDFGKNADAINYYLGQFFYNNVGDYQKYFSKINPDSPFYLFAVLRDAENGGDIKKLEQVMRDHPLFVPAANKLVGYHIQHGNKRSALRVIDRALDSNELNEAGRAFFIKSRAQVHYAFGDLKAAQDDIRTASDTLMIDGEIVSLQAKIWAAQNREIENAYEYAMNLVKRNPTDVLAWDTLGCVVAVREGVIAALDVLERVGEVSETCSSLFEHLGDLYVEVGEYENARNAYLRAIELSDDGLTVVPIIERKLRKIK